MGQGNSIASGGESYARRTTLANQLPDQILTFFFSNADLLDLINLSSLEACSRYVFTTSQSLETLFQKLQVYPQKGKQGEIFFAPIQRLIPVPQRVPGGNQTLLERKKTRDNLCMEVSYYYVRIFQIYAALALTTLNANPMRKTTALAARMSTTAPLQAGGRIPARSADTAFNQFLQKIVGTPMVAFQEFLDKKSSRSILTFTLSTLTPKPNYEIYIDFTNVNVSKTEVSFKATLEGQDISQELDVSMGFAGSNVNVAELRFDGILVLTMITRGGPWIPHVEGVRVDFAETVNDFVQAKYAIGANAGKRKNNLNRRAPSAPSTTSTYAAPAGIPTGPSAPSITGYEKYDAIKKLFQDRFNQKAFPKAFCVARAMTLLLPVFEEELTNKANPFYSQVCKNTYDFEVTDAQMPKNPKTPVANLYFRSLVALYYDDFRMTNPEKPPEFYQTETGRSELRRDSALLAKLYNVDKDPENFLESSSPFKAFPICAGQGQQDRLIQIDNREFVRNLYTNVVSKMLAFQEEHTKRVNVLLTRMFEVRLKKDGGKEVVDSIKLTAEIRNGGRAAIDAIGRDARALLKDYYWKSEALFFKGILMFMETQGKPQIWHHI